MVSRINEISRCTHFTKPWKTKLKPFLSVRSKLYAVRRVKKFLPGIYSACSRSKPRSNGPEKWLGHRKHTSSRRIEHRETSNKRIVYKLTVHFSFRCAVIMNGGLRTWYEQLRTNGQRQDIGMYLSRQASAACIRVMKTTMIFITPTPAPTKSFVYIRNSRSTRNFNPYEAKPRIKFL